jgi:CubicO group peptidase (beta-lactamase class C family)
MRLIPILIGGLLLIGCPGGSGSLDDDDDATEEGPAWEALPEVLAYAFDDEVEDLGAPGCAVAIEYDGTLYAQGFGSRHPEQDDPVLPTTLFRIGSVTKMLTTTALLQQVEAERLALDETLEQHVPGLELEGVARVREVTLHQLISHQTGISDHTPIAGGADDELLLDYTHGGFEDGAYMMAPAGSFWNYANPNFSLAGLITEQVDGRWYREILAEDLFAPLGMDRTLFLGEDVADDGDFATGLTTDWTGQTEDEALAGALAYDDGWSRPAGFAWSSVLDLVTFGRFLLDGDEAVLSSELHEQLVAPHVNTLSFLDALHYGYGLMHWSGVVAEGDDWFDVATIEHGGAIPGFAAELFTLPGHDLVMATLCSTDGAYFDRAKAAVLEELVGLEGGELPDLQMDPDDLDGYVGVYDEQFAVGPMHVSREGDGLVVEMPILDEYDVPYGSELFWTSRDNFYLVVQGHPFGATFISEEEGRPARWLRTRYFVGDRIEPEDEPTRAADDDAARIARLQLLLDRLSHPANALTTDR